MTDTVSAVIDGKEVSLGTLDKWSAVREMDRPLHVAVIQPEPFGSERFTMTGTARLEGPLSWRTVCLRLAHTKTLLLMRAILPRSRRSRVASRLRKWVGKEIARRERLGVAVSEDDDELCACRFDPESADDGEEPWHYRRTCMNCGGWWWGLHCPHDGYQNPCPHCGTRPRTLADHEVEGAPPTPSPAK